MQVERMERRGFPEERRGCSVAGMSAILDVPEIRARVHRWTVAEFRALAEDQAGFEHSELIRGVIVEKEMKTWLHDKLVDIAGEHLRGAARGTWWVRQETSLHLADSMPEPDVSVVTGTRADYDDKPRTAALVVEIAVTSLVSDREKAALYAEAGVGEYWIVLAEAGQVEVYRRPVGGVYQERRTYACGEVIEGVEVIGGACAVEMLFM